MTGFDLFGNPVTFGLAAERRPDGLVAHLEVTVAPGYHVYAPTTEEGIPLSIQLPEESPFRMKSPTKFPESPDGHLNGRFNVELPLEGKGDQLELVVAYQACESQICLMPTTETLHCRVP